MRETALRACVIVAWLAVDVRPAVADAPVTEAEDPVSEIRIGRGVRNKALVAELPPGGQASEGDRLYAWARVIGLKGQVVEFVWLREEVEVFRFATTVGSNRWRTWSTMKLPWQQLYAAGGAVWAVELRDAAGQTLAETGFVVTGPCRRTDDCE